LDVKQLGLVVNYECPNHMEDYVHRVGRTGRAGNKGTAYTFVTPLQEKYALDIMKALKLSGVPVPSDLETLANGFLRKVKSGQASYSGSGFGGKGLDKLDKERDVQRKQQKQHFNATEGVEEEDEESGGEVEKGDAVTVPEHVRLQGAAGDYVTKHKADIGNRLIQAQSVVNARVGSAGSTSFEFEINDYPQKARWQVTRREQLSAIVEASGASVTTKGVYIPPGKTTPAGQRKLYLHVQSESDAALQLARKEIMRILKEAVLESSAAAPAAARGRYDVV
jgi:ATP-dependent RNA helicase DDX46/PRP5